MTRPLSPAEITELQTDFSHRAVEEIREAWCRALEEHGHLQCIGAWGPMRGATQMKCAAVILGDIVHGPKENRRLFNQVAAKNGGGPVDMSAYYDGIGARAGLNPHQIGVVLVDNDGWVDGATGKRHERLSFRQIAKKVRSWFA
jgi:hypothetical protein